MGIISWIIVGLIAGWRATDILGGRGSIMSNLAIGLVGAIVGGLLFTNLSVQVAPNFFGSPITATTGAII